MAATLTANYYNGGSEGAGTDATTGMRFNREDTQMGTSGTIPIPTTSPNTVYSWYKNIALAVTNADGAVTITNRSVKLGTNVSLPTGAFLYFLSTGTYRQASAGTAPPSMASNGAVPTDPNGDGTYAAMTLNAQAYDGAGASAGSTGRNGNFCRMVFGLDARYTGGAGALTLPNIIMGYDEA
jgi:hypothetical protein